MNIRLFAACAALTVASLYNQAHAAMTVALFLKAGGADIHGNSTVMTHGRENSIECLSFGLAVKTGVGMAAGRRQYEPIIIRKRIDKSSPLLMKALAQNQVISGQFKFYRPAMSGAGAVEQFYSISISGARIASINLISPDASSPGTANLPMIEEVTFAFSGIQAVYVIDGVEFEDSFSGGAGSFGTTAPTRPIAPGIIRRPPPVGAKPRP